MPARDHPKTQNRGWSYQILQYSLSLSVFLKCLYVCMCGLICQMDGVQFTIEYKNMNLKIMRSWIASFRAVHGTQIVKCRIFETSRYLGDPWRSNTGIGVVMATCEGGLTVTLLGHVQIIPAPRIPACQYGAVWGIQVQYIPTKGKKQLHFSCKTYSSTLFVCTDWFVTIKEYPQKYKLL